MYMYHLCNTELPYVYLMRATKYAVVKMQMILIKLIKADVTRFKTIHIHVQTFVLH